MSNAHGNRKGPSLRSPDTSCPDSSTDETVRTRSVRTTLPAEDPWEVFELDEEALEPEPEYGDFWGELDDDCDNRG